MKKLITATGIVALTATGIVALVLVACSGTQQRAELNLAKNESECAIECAVEKALENVTPEQATLACATKCGTEIITNPDSRQSFLRLLSGAKAGAMKYGASQPDAGK